jgi:hypothetical protein
MNVCQREIPGYSATFLKLQKIFTLHNPQNHIWYPAKERKGPAIPHIQTTPVQKGKQDNRQTYFNGSSTVEPFEKIAQPASIFLHTILLTYHLGMLLSSYQIQTVTSRAQARFAAAIVLLGGGDAGMPHGILYSD